ncbi:MAG: MFS transporter [Dehalococcoidales bacterium]|nr:MFS transporter [Dehalococcoidales bacterium]
MTNYKTYRYRWIILIVYMYIAALTQLYWLNFSAIDTYLEDNLSISAIQVGMLTLVFPIVYILLSVPSGFIIDKKGFKYGLAIGVIFTGFFCLLRLVNPASYLCLLTSQIGIAIGQPFILNGITKLVVTWFPPHEEATAVGLGSLALFVGMIIGLGLTPLLVESAGFESMLLVYGILGVLGVLLFFPLVKAKPATPTRVMKEENITFRSGIAGILKTKNFIILGFIAMIGIGVFNGLATWLEKILNEQQNIPMVDAGLISAILIFSGMLGCIAIPIFSDKIKRRKPFLILAASVGTICIILLMFTSSFVVNAANAFILGFFLLPALPIILTTSAEITGSAFAGISVAYLQLLGNGAAVVIVPVMETLRNASNQHILPLAFLATLLFIAIILAIRIKETGNFS